MTDGYSVVGVRVRPGSPERRVGRRAAQRRVAVVPSRSPLRSGAGIPNPNASLSVGASRRSRKALRDRCHPDATIARWPTEPSRPARTLRRVADEQISVFISYAHEDVEVATAIQDRLEADGFAVWIDEGALRAGDSLFERITTAIHANEFVVALITEASVDSRWCQHEIHTAMTSGLNREGVKLLPVRFGEVAIPVTLEDTYCPAVNPESMDEGVARLAKDARSHHEDRRRANEAGLPLPTTGTEGAGRIVLPKAAIVQEPPRPPVTQSISIVGIVKEGVGRPRDDGTRGSALYAVPVQLSRAPSGLWAELFLRCWDRPPQFTTMHRPGIARVNGDTILLDGTTMEELEKYHARTLRLCVATVNEQEQAIIERERLKQEADRATRREHEREVDEIANRIRFDE